MTAPSAAAVLDLGNVILASANVIISFSLFVYIITHNYRSAVAQAFCALMAFVSIVYLVDVSLAGVHTPVAASMWLRAQWAGIAFVPAAYFHFSDALLRTTGSTSRARRVWVVASYLIGVVALALVLATDYIVSGLSAKDGIFHLLPGPFFWAFAAYYVLTSFGGWINISRGRARCLTTASRRRMSYLMLAFVAPSIGVFPYLLVPTAALHLSFTFIALLTLVGNIGMALMTVVIGYIVAYQGVLLPDRVVKHSLIHFLLRGPLVAILVIVLQLVIPNVDQIFGLPRDTILIVTVAGTIVVSQVLINLAKPALDRVIYRQDRAEVTWIQTLEERLLTSSDLEQILENTLIALCDLLRVPSGFVVTMQGARLSIRVFCGPREAADDFMAHVYVPELIEQVSKSRQGEFFTNKDFVLADGHWLLPLRSRRDVAVLGILGIRAQGAAPDFTDEDLEAVYDLVQRAEYALEDTSLQQQIFAMLQGLSELDELQAFRSTPRYVRSGSPQRLDSNPIHSGNLADLVKEALGQLWGGPRLSQSPLLRLHVVQSQLPASDNVPTKALRAVLQEAIARLKPSGERSMTASAWVVYNILELKYLQRLRIRDIVRRLAMSESDYYRKQRIAIEQVAETVAHMERAAEQPAPDDPVDAASTS